MLAILLSMLHHYIFVQCIKIMWDWDDELNRIMARKMKDFGVQSTRNTPNTNKALITSPITLTDANFEEATRKYPLLVVDFWAPWCGPCRMVSPVIEELADELAGKVVFGKLNVDENPIVSNKFGIRSIPTLAIFKNGRAIDGIVGAASKSGIISKISTYVKGSS
jgi:thioredoxin 1